MVVGKHTRGPPPNNYSNSPHNLELPVNDDDDDCDDGDVLTVAHLPEI